MATQTYDGRTYGNGQVPAAILAHVDGDPDAQLREDAAASWNRARADVKRRTGYDLHLRGWNRTLAEQEKFFHAAYMPQATGGTDPRWYQGVRYVRRPGKSSAAIPGRSNHGWAVAGDIEDFGASGDWTNPRQVAATPILREHGWTDDEGRQPWVDEPWHRVYDPSRDQHKTTTTGKDWLDMATEKDVQDAVLAVLKSAAGREAIARGVWTTDGVIPAPSDTDTKKNPFWTGSGWLGSIRSNVLKLK